MAESPNDAQAGYFQDAALTDYRTPLDGVGFSVMVDDPAGVGALVRISPDEYRVLFDASAQVGAECMRAAGFSDFPDDVYVPAPLYNPATRPAEEGYHVAPVNPVGTQTSALDAWLAATPGALEAWGGDGVAAGCLAASETAIYGSPSGFVDAMSAFNRARNEWMNGVSESKEVDALDAEWSACMTVTGTPATDPTEPWRATWPGDAPTDDEIALRAADLRCRAEVEYSARMTALLGPLFDEWLGRNATTVRDVRNSIAEWLERAATINARS